MATALRLFLIAGSLAVFLYGSCKLRKEQIQVMDTLFWSILLLSILATSLFPEVAVKCASMLGVESAVNFVYLLVIFFLLARLFSLNIRICRLEQKVRDYILYMATKECADKEG